MAGNLTFAMIKPGAVSRNLVGQIISMIEGGGFRIVAIKKVQLVKSDISKFYEEHVGKEFFEDLEQFMTSGPVFPIVLEKDNAVLDFRTLLGNTDPFIADEGTIRKLFATAKNRNACHGSDSDENAIREMTFFFNKLELL